MAYFVGYIFDGKLSLRSFVFHNRYANVFLTTYLGTQWKWREISLTVRTSYGTLGRSKGIFNFESFCDCKLNFSARLYRLRRTTTLYDFVAWLCRKTVSHDYIAVSCTSTWLYCRTIMSQVYCMTISLCVAQLCGCAAYTAALSCRYGRRSRSVSYDYAPSVSQDYIAVWCTTMSKEIFWSLAPMQVKEHGWDSQ